MELLVAGLIAAFCTTAAPPAASRTLSPSAPPAVAGPRQATPGAGQAAQEPTAESDRPKKSKGDKPKAQKKKGDKKPPAEPAASAGAEERGVRLVWKDRPSLRVGQWLRLDARFKVQEDVRYSQQDLTEAGGVSEWGLRRAGISGSVGKYFEYQVEHDLYPGGKWRDVYLNIRPLAAVQVRAGKFKVPFSLDRLIGVTDYDFVNRTRTTDTLVPGRDVGVMVHGRVLRQAVQYSVGAFRDDGEQAPSIETPPYFDPGTTSTAKSGSRAARITVAPFRWTASKALRTLEVGVNGVWSEVPEGRNHLKGESVLGYSTFGRSAYINGRRLREGVDIQWLPGPFSLRAEYLRVREARIGLGVGNETTLDNDLPDLVSEGWYASGSWLLTGEKKSGDLDPRRRFGAVELVGRFEEIRFGGGTSAEPPSDSPRAANVAGNRERVVTVGVNWYFGRNVKVQVDGIREDVRDLTRAPLVGRSPSWSAVCRLQFAM